MDGHVLLQYARFRMDEEGDFGRVRRQQQVMNAIFSQLKNPLILFVRLMRLVKQSAIRQQMLLRCSLPKIFSRLLVEQEGSID